MDRTYPAPWRVDAYLPAQSIIGEYVFSVRADDGEVVVGDCGKDVAERVVLARNAGADSRSADAVRERLMESVRYLSEEAEAVRAHFQRELGALTAALEECRGRNEREKQGSLF